jgi:hypothetical protein
MPILKNIAGINIRSLILSLIIPLALICISSCDNGTASTGDIVSAGKTDSGKERITSYENQQVYAMLCLPKNPNPGEPFRILTIGGSNLRKAKVVINGPSGITESVKSNFGEESPYWKIDDFKGFPAGKFKAAFIVDQKEISNLEFIISQRGEPASANVVWKTVNGWDSNKEKIYSAWINALFHGCSENSSWLALHEVVQNKAQNFLYNYLSIGEDDPNGKNRLIMQPDCADNPFFLRAYFSWKLGLPFGYHICDRGYLGRNPRTGQWITNESSSSKTNPVLAFNVFLRRVMNDVHSGTARTALNDENSDYYPVALNPESLIPGIVFADPYGHTLIIIGHVPQTKDHPGLLLSVDAQPDGTIGIKRFWKGNFLFNTSEVIGEPGFKAFRPVSIYNGVMSLMKNEVLTASSGFTPFSLQQRKMKSDVFYHTMERIINPEPLDPAAAMLDLIQALHEQLLVRVTSVANGEAYLKSHQGIVIPMPSNASAIFEAGGQWENFSTPNRDLRLLIAIDAVLDFPDLVTRSPGDFNISGRSSPEQVKNKLQAILNQKVAEFYISYTRTNGAIQKLSLQQILERKDAFEMGYNPNDGIEIRWGAAENSDEMAACRRHTPSYQLERMNSVRTWFHKRQHPPT